MDDEESKKYKGVIRGEKNKLHSNGLQDNKAYWALLSKMRLHPNAIKLRELMREIEEKLEELRSFDSKLVIEIECEQLEQKLKDAVESAVDHLKKIETNMMKQISEYRERCLANHQLQQTSKPENSTKCELNTLMKEVDKFNVKWNDYFERIEVNATENEIKDALLQTGLYVSTMESMKARMRKEALNWEKMEFHVNSQFLEEWNQIGQIEVIPETKAVEGRNFFVSLQMKENQLKVERNLNNLEQRKEPPKTRNPVISTKPKKMTVKDKLSFTLTGHSDFVRQVLFLPDGRIASCSDDKTIKIWNVEKGKELFQLKGHKKRVYSIALLPNGHLASSSAEGTIKIWDLEQRKEIRSIKAHSGSVVSLRVLKTGNLVSFSCDDTIKIWNLNSADNEPVSIMTGPGNTNCLIQLSGILSNDYFLICSRHRENEEECMLRVWNPNDPNSSIKSVPTGFNDVCSLLVLSNDQVALGCDISGTIKIIDLNNKALSRTKERAHYKTVTSLVQLSNGNLISAGEDASILNLKVWNLFDMRLLQTINSGHSKWIWSLSISGDERFLASGSIDYTIKLWPISIEKTAQ